MELLSRLGTASKAGLVGILIGIGSLGIGIKESYSQAMIKTATESPSVYMGQPFRMDVTLETTNVPNVKIASCDWDVSVSTSRLNFVSSSLPTNNDFFEGFTMDSTYNRIDNFINGSTLDDNIRMVSNPTDGPTNKIGILGSYWFTPIKTNDNVKFGLSQVHIYDSFGNLVSTTTTNIPFNILPAPPATTNYNVTMKTQPSEVYANLSFSNNASGGNTGTFYTNNVSTNLPGGSTNTFWVSPEAITNEDGTLRYRLEGLEKVDK